jgi:ferric-dicitrate binding protein FerR (iron transport regulator)
MQKLTDDLVEKFLSRNCTAAEAAMVSAYLRDNPDEQYLLREYEQADSETPLPEGYRDEMLAFITEKTSESKGADVEVDVRPRKGRVRHFWKWTAAAAVVILVYMGWNRLQPGPKVPGQQLAANYAPEASWIEKYNHGKAALLLTLPDSSKVRLLPGARMRYRAGFGRKDQRDVQITGKAYFDVAKKLDMPFTVYSEGLQTRVLGTSFEVNANPYSDKIKIKLLTGKVLVTLEGGPDVNGQKDYYLSPGQELVFSKSTRDVAINSPEKRPAEASVAKAHPVSADTISNWYMFNNQSLADVFDQLSAIYNVEIDYSRGEIRNLYFIGKLEKKDSLVEIIRDIALLNHLSVTSLNGKYIIKKGKP